MIPTSSVEGAPTTPETTIPSAGTSQTPLDVRGAAPLSNKRWMTSPIHIGKKLQPRTKAPDTRNAVASSLYAGLDEWPENTDVSPPSGPPTPPVEETVDLTAENVAKPIDVLSTLAADKKSLHLCS